MASASVICFTRTGTLSSSVDGAAFSLRAPMRTPYLLASSGRTSKGSKTPSVLAIDADPNFAPAYNGMANAHLGLEWPSNQDFEIARKMADSTGTGLFMYAVRWQAQPITFL
jgi:hypothetical protein